ncbi:MAG: hypothetical protein IKV03_06125 [Alphaproteobacteria bacterium]|nr:hypothetical protein [Alphaproteobacteria bacterium]
MEKSLSDIEKYAYIKAETSLKTPQEMTIWTIKMLSHMFFKYLVYNDVDLNKEKFNYRQMDISQTFDGNTIFSAALKTGYYEQAAHFIHAMKTHPELEKSLNLSDPQTIVELKKLFDMTPKKTKPVRTSTEIAEEKENERQKQKLRYVLTRVLSPLTIMSRYMNKENETAFSAAIKMGDSRSAYKALQNLQHTSQENILKELNISDPEIKTLLKNITHPHTTNKHYRILTAKLQQILTQQNFVEQIRGKKLSYQDHQNLIEDEKYDAQEQNLAIQFSSTTPSTNATTQPRAPLWEWAKTQGRN